MGQLTTPAAAAPDGQQGGSQGRDSSRDSRRIAGLDALRAAAIALVVPGHVVAMVMVAQGARSLPLPVMASGYLGVQLFFVLSGLLIGNLLLDIVAQTPTLGAWGRFMARRAMRTLPAYLLWLLGLRAIAPPPGDAAAYLLRYASFTQNLLGPMPPGWFFPVSWSLTVEEWFYLLFSATLLAAARIIGRPAIWPALALFLAAPLLGRLLASPSPQWDPEIRKVAWLSLDAIAHGVAAAALLRRSTWPMRHARALAIAGLAITLASLPMIDSAFQPAPEGTGAWLSQALVLNVTATGFALLLPAALALRHLPGWPGDAIRRLSELAYPLYLTHFTLLSLVAPGWLTGGPARVAGGVALALAGTWLLAEASRRWVEAPIMALRPPQMTGGGPVAAPAAGPAPRSGD